MSDQLPRRSRASRDDAVHFDLVGGTGPITAMCSFDAFMEVYKQDRTFRVRTPEIIDPLRTNLHAPFVTEVVAEVGSASPIVARVLLQSVELLESAPLKIKVSKKDVLQRLHECKESLLDCEAVAARLGAQVDAIAARPEAWGDARQRVVNLPQVEKLGADVTSFLIAAKRAVRSMCQLPSAFAQVSSDDNNFDHLAKHLAAAVGEQDPLTLLVQERAPGIRHLIDLRNFQEHPGERRTVVENFAVLPNGDVAPPMWYVSGDTKRPIAAEMRAAVTFLIETAEELLLSLVDRSVDDRFPLVLLDIEPADRDPVKPIRFRIGMRSSKAAAEAKKGH